ncbi:hypothetical protein HMPREF1032_02636 [Subdoligranulum sp. 4_3_54A2FAA]|nr:hypothetical protein HMPREF1032_02636 [Subdoligranulum sp. 4_3_54A2FAA]
MKANRNAYLAELYDLMKENPDIIVVDVDNISPGGEKSIPKDFPDRFIQCGIAEQNMMGVAAGLAYNGKIPFCATFAVFVSMRCVEQVRNSVCYPNANVKIIGTHAGLETGPDGGTHQGIEDLAIMRALPNMVVLAPSTPNMTVALTRVIAEHKGACYMRFGKAPAPELYAPEDTFEIGGSRTLREGTDFTIIAEGNMVCRSLEAAEQLAKEGLNIRVVDMYSVKPIDRAAIQKAAAETGGIVTVEDHNVFGGLGSAVAEVVCEVNPVRMLRIGVQDHFGHSGLPDELYKMYHLTPDDIAQKCRQFAAGASENC